MTTLKKYSIPALCILVGFGIGAFFYHSRSQENKGSSNEDCKYEWINPLRCDMASVPVQAEYSVFKKELLAELENEKKKGNLSEASLYFRDLNNGPIFYFNEQAQFSPMSLLKLPLMMAVYKYAENNPKILEEKMRTPAAFAQNTQIMESGKTLSPDTEYSIDDMVRYMIVYSDNRSVDMLTVWLNQKGTNHEVLRRTLSDIGLVGYEANLSDTNITVRQYSSLFRILYNASYLSPEMSEKALDILQHSEFSDGLVGKLPENIKVAHKFGVRAYIEGEQQLHDCGIIYLESSPYIMCLMTRGKEYEKLSNYIQTLSKKVFDEVSERSQ